MLYQNLCLMLYCVLDEEIKPLITLFVGVCKSQKFADCGVRQ